jgi:hypothetical protein
MATNIDIESFDVNVSGRSGVADPPLARSALRREMALETARRQWALMVTV